MKKPMNLFLRLIIISILILTVGKYIALWMYDDPEVVEQVVRSTFIVALIVVPIHHFILIKRYHNSQK